MVGRPHAMLDGAGNNMDDIAPLARTGHAAHCRMCLLGLPDSQVEVESSTMALAFYCLGTLDVLRLLDAKTSVRERGMWTEWIWEQQTRGRYGTGFRPGTFMTPQRAPDVQEDYGEYNTPHLIMSYTALLSLCILRDDFARLDRAGLCAFLRACQEPDGSFSTVPNARDSDLRTTYCAFAVCSMLDDWSAIDVPRACAFIHRCRTYEGGYGQAPACEAQGGTTYCALATLRLADPSAPPLPAADRAITIRWLVNNQRPDGGFAGRTAKDADACYCFWCGAALQILGAHDLVNAPALQRFLSRCQFKYGGIAKAPGEHPDPYHTYLALAALSMYAPACGLDAFDPVLNARADTAAWARRYVPDPERARSAEGS